MKKSKGNDINYFNLSPRSRKALNLIGIEDCKLYYLSKKDFIDRHTELKSASEEVKDKRYEHFEKTRNERIRLAKEKRDELIQSETYDSKQFKAVSNMSKTQDNFSIIQDIEKLELMKNQQIGEIKNMIDFEIKREELRKKNEEKQLEQLRKEEELKESKRREQLEKENKQKMHEYERKKQLELEELEMKRKFLELEEKEKKQIEEEQRKRNQIENEKKLKQLENAQKQEELRKKLDKITIEQQTELEKRQKGMEKKEEERINTINEKKRRQLEADLVKREIAREKIQHALRKNEEDQQNKIREYENKVKQQEEERMRANIELEKKNRQQQELIKRRDEKITEVLRRNEEQMKKKVDDYNNRQKSLQKIQKVQEEKKQKDNIIKLMKRSEKEKRIVQTRNKNDTLIEDRRTILTNKFNESECKIQKQKDINTKTFTKKFLVNAIKQEESNEKVFRFEKQMEYQKQLKQEELDEKQRRVDEMQRRKQELNNKKRQLLDDLNMRKAEMLEKVNILLTNGKSHTKEDIYRQVFTEEEIGRIYSPNSKTPFKTEVTNTFSNSMNDNDNKKKSTKSEKTLKNNKKTISTDNNTAMSFGKNNKPTLAEEIEEDY